MASIAMKDVKKSYGKVDVIHGIDLEIEDGEFVALVGPSGCGKSTLLRLLAGLEPITGGDLLFDGERVNELAPAEREIAMVFQSYALYPHLSVRKNLSFGLENLRMERSEIARRVAEAARMLELEPYLDRKPKALSGGQRQRVAIGRAIVRHPRVFLFDEPLSNLDAKLRVQTRAEISKLHRALHTTMVYVTHDQVEAMTMARKIVVLNAGRVEQVGAPLELFERPANTFVAGFIGSPRMNLYPGRVVSASDRTVTVETADTGRMELPYPAKSLPDGTEVLLGIRPSHVRLARDGEGLPLRVEQVESMGHETFIYGRIGGSKEETIVHVQGHLAASPDETLPVAFDPAFTHAFLASNGQACERAAA
jgi:multiple sugar transport system ATP-binding protein